MRVNLREIREQLAAALDGLGYRTYDVLPENAEMPAVLVGWPDEVRYYVDGSGGVEVDLDVTIAVDRADWVEAQRQLDAALDPAGPPAAIAAHVTDAWRQAIVTTAGNVRPIESPPCLAVDLSVSVYAL